MNSPLATIAKQLRRLPWNKRYLGDASLPQQSELDHVATGIIFALISIICGLLWTPLYWLYLATWIYHCVFIELVHDTWIKKKNSATFIGTTEIIMPLPKKTIIKNTIQKINWNAVIAQCLERTVGHVICLPVLIWRLL